MGYRGEDLDLRTPQSWSATAADLGAPGDTGPVGGRGRRVAPARNGGPAGPIWVDEALLASCNHAYDVALAHRSAEVRLEHLLHALTRIDTAAEILESRGVRVAGLRRDTATVIAGELPVAPGGGAAQPRRSGEFAEVLRLASAHAARRNQPGGVEDVLAVLLDDKVNLAGVSLLYRHAGHGSHASSGSMLDYGEPMPGARYAAPEPRYSEPIEREPVREAPRMRNARPSYRPPEPPTGARPTPVDSFQNARLDALEQAVRALGRDLSEERSGFANILQDLQRDFGAHRADQSRSSGGVHERLQAIEELVTSRGGEPGFDGGIGNRLAAIEDGLARVDEVNRALADFSDRLRGLEDAVRLPRNVDLSTVHERVSAIERTVRDSLGETSRGWLGLSDKLKDVEAAIALRSEAAVDLTPVSNRLDIIEEALLGRDTDAERQLSDRLGAVEQALAAQRAQTFETNSSLVAEMKALSGAVATQASGAERFQASVGERLSSVASGLERHRAELVNGIERHRTELVAGIERQHSAYAEQFDRQRSEFQGLMDQRLGQYSRELGEVHDALVKLNANQHTLAGAIDQWRAEGSGDLGVIANRIAGLEREAGKPMQLLSAVAANMDTVHRIAVDKNNRRRRFWYWLFGSDDWLASSWPGTAKRIDTARNPVRKA